MNRKTLFAATLALSILPLTAEARCNEDGSELNATWTLYLSTVTGGGQHVQRCANVRGSNGGFRGARCETIRLGASDGLTITRRCDIAAGVFVTLSNGTQLGCQLVATMDRDHNAIDGHIKCDPQPNWVARFIRR
jgi:hypothetical protein